MLSVENRERWVAFPVVWGQLISGGGVEVDARVGPRCRPKV